MDSKGDPDLHKLSDTRLIAKKVINLDNGQWLKLEAILREDGRKFIVLTGQQQSDSGEVVDVTTPRRIGMKEFDCLIDFLQKWAIQETGAEFYPGLFLYSHHSRRGKMYRKLVLGGKKFLFFDEIDEDAPCRVRRLIEALQTLRAILENPDIEKQPSLTEWLPAHE